MIDLLPNDEELVGTKPIEEEVPLITDVQLRNDKLDQHLDMQTTILRTGLDHSDPTQNFLDIKANPDKEGQLQHEVDKKNALDIAEVDNWLRQQYATTPEELNQLTAKGKALLQEYNTEHNSPVAKEQAVIDQLTDMNQPFDLRKARQVNSTLRLAVANDIQKIAANQGWLDKVYENFGIYLLPFGSASFPKDVKDVVGGTIFANGRQLQDFIIAFKSLPQERQVVEYPYVRDLILQQTDSNQSNAIALLLGLIEPGSGEGLKHRLYEDTFWTALGLGEVSTISKAIFGATKYLSKLTNAAKLAADVGNKEVAAEVAAASMADKNGAAAQASKLSPEEAMAAAVPVRYSSDLSQMEGVSAGIQKNVSEYLDKLVQANQGLQDGSLTIREGYVTEKEVMDRVYKEVDEVTNTVKDVYNEDAIVSNVKVTKADHNSAVLSYDVTTSINKEVPIVNTETAIGMPAKGSELKSQLDSLDDKFTFTSPETNKYKTWDYTSKSKDAYGVGKIYLSGQMGDTFHIHIPNGQNTYVLTNTTFSLEDGEKAIKANAIGIAKLIDNVIKEGKEFAIFDTENTKNLSPVIKLLESEGYRFELEDFHKEFDTVNKIEKVNDKVDRVKQHPNYDNILDKISILKLKSFPYEYTTTKNKIPKTETVTESKTETINKTVTATRNDITGTLDLTEVPTNKTREYIFSPSFRYVKGELGNLSKTAAKNLLTSNVNQNVLRSAWREANKGMSTAELSKLDKVMMAGDLYKNESGAIGKNFTVLELRAGVDTPYGVIKLESEKEIASYYKNRAFMDMVADLENNELRVKLQSQGLKSTYIDDTQVMIKPYDITTAQAEVTKGNVKRVLDLDEQKIITNSEELKEQLSKKILVRLYEDMPIDKLAADGLQEGEHIRYALINRDAIKELPKDVLTRKDGYVPALYKNEEYFVKEKLAYTSNDEQMVRNITRARYASKKQAEREAIALNEKAKLEGKWDGKHPSTAPYIALSDKELTVEQLLGDASVSGRSMVFGKRSTREIPFGVQETTPERISVLEAFDRNIRQLSKLMAYNANRIRSEQMWVNTAKEWGFDVRSFNDDLPLGSKVTNQLMALKNQIRTWNQLPTKEERLWSQLWQSVHDWMVDGSYSVGVPKDSFSSLLWLKHKEPVRAARAAVFHVLLGMWNVAQVVVQSSQAAIAFSLQPTNGIRAFKYANTLRLTDVIQDEKALIANIDKIRNHPEFKEIGQDVHELVNLWQRSGFGLASKVNSNYTMASDVAGFSKNFFSKLLENGEYFYQAGVNFANRYTFANAYIEYKKLHPGKVSDEGLKEIIARTDRDTFHMLSSDKSQLYKGGFSVPLQFSQIIMKSVEAMFGKEFTWLEKAKILSGQLALYGLSGYNLSKAYEASMRDFGVEPSQLKGTSKGFSKFASGGLLELAPLMMFGADLDISNRVAIFNGVGQWGLDMILDDRPIWQKALGAVGTVAGKTQRTISKLSTIALGGMGDEPMTKGDMILGLQEILKVPSSTNNLLTAIYMSRFNKILDKNGIAIIEKEFSTAEIIAEAAGFKPSQISQTYELMRYNTLKTKEFDDLANSVVYFINQYRGLYDSPDNKELAINTRKAIQVILNPLDPLERAEVMKRAKNKIEHPKNKYENAMNDFVKNRVANDFVNSLLQDKEEAMKND